MCCVVCCDNNDASDILAAATQCNRTLDRKAQALSLQDPQTTNKVLLAMCFTTLINGNRLNPNLSSTPLKKLIRIARPRLSAPSPLRDCFILMSKPRCDLVLHAVRPLPR